MRILYILSGTGLHDGATKSFLAMADSVAAAGHSVAVVVPDENGVTPTLRERGWDVLSVRYMFATLPYLSWQPSVLIKFIPRLAMAVKYNIKARRKVIEFAKIWRPDIIHDNTSVTDLGHYAARSLKIPHFVHIREYGWRDFKRINPGLKKRLMSPDTYVAAITSSLAAFRGKGLESSHLRVIYNGIVPSSKFFYNSDKSPWIFYAGRIREAKGVGDLIEAYLAYASSVLASGRTPLGLKLAGAWEDGAFYDSLRQRISASGLDGFVQWLGEREDIRSLYSVAAATVVPSKSEGFGRVMPEAMAQGSLCVVRNSGGLAEQLENGRRESGHDIAFGYDRIEELVSILSEIDESYREGGAYSYGGVFYNMIADSQKTVGKLYSFESYAKCILDYYSYILKESRDK